MDGLPIQPIAASFAGVSLAARQQEEQSQRRVRREQLERRVEAPAKVDPVDDAPQRDRRREQEPRKPKREPPTDDHVDLTA